MPRPEKPIAGTGAVAELARKLRALRYAGGSPPYRIMASQAHFAASVLSQAASGDQLPSLAVVVAYVRYFDGDIAEFEELWLEALRDRPPRLHAASADDQAAPPEGDTEPAVVAADEPAADGPASSSVRKRTVIRDVLVVTVLLVLSFLFAWRSDTTLWQADRGDALPVAVSGSSNPYPLSLQPVVELPPLPPAVMGTAGVTPGHGSTPTDADFVYWDNETGDLVMSLTAEHCVSERTFVLSSGSARFTTAVSVHTEGDSTATVMVLLDGAQTLSTTLTYSQKTLIDLDVSRASRLTLRTIRPDGVQQCPTAQTRWAVATIHPEPPRVR